MGPIGDQRLKQLAQTSAWILLALVVILLVSGWGITQTGVIHSLSLGLIDRKLADYIHRASNIPLAFFFLSHVMINLKLSFSRKARSTLAVWLVYSLMLVIGVAVMAIVVYLEYFRLGG
jgi:thiosulfate reductase cytochrome b subunit